MRRAWIGAGVLLATVVTSGSGRPLSVERTYWPDGTLRTETHYANGVRSGEYRSFYTSGAPYELRTYVDGREHGPQRSWTEDGELFLNYEVRNGRRYGYVNAKPCLPVSSDELVVRDEAVSGATSAAGDVTGGVQ